MTRESLPIFFVEAAELSQEIEAALLQCESGTADTEVVNGLFRAVHTMKGSAGMFGLETIVAFAHRFETVLDRVRTGKIEMTAPLVSLLLECHDHLGRLVDACGAPDFAPESPLTGELAAIDAALGSRLGEFSGAEVPTAPKIAQAAPREFVQPLGTPTEQRCWHISIRYMPELFADGLDALAPLRYLQTLGRVVAIELVDDALPPLHRFDPERCYLGFEIRFEGDIDKQRIDSVFEFVRDDCVLTILPPRSRVTDYVRLIRELPETENRLGDILIRCGSITRHELEQALRWQQSSLDGGVAPPLGEILIEHRLASPAVVEAAIEKQRAQRESRTRETRSIRVDTDKLEVLIDLVGELVIAGAATNLMAQRANLSELSESSLRMARLVEEVRDRTLKLRMMQMSGTFARFSRVVRDVSKELGKDIRLQTHGGETELDKTLIEKITDPLTHLVRNSIDHGIEPAQDRVARGKPAQGCVTLNAYHDSGSVVIEVSDDGGGLKREKILKKARDRGLVSAEQTLSDREVFALIFEPGFSTAEAVTNLSGRGVGMDVVKRNVMQLRGTVEIDSQEGAGTTVRIRLPLTLAIIEGFLVKAGGSSFVIPLEMVEECVESSQAEGLLDQGHRYLDLRGDVLPYVRLRQHFNLKGKPSRRESIVVVRCGPERAGFVVDELLGEHQTVIKPLSRVLNSVRGLSGSTILADGAIALIVDTPQLIEQCKAKVKRRPIGESLSP